MSEQTAKMQPTDERGIDPLPQPAPVAKRLGKHSEIFKNWRTWPWPGIGWYAAGAAGWIGVLCLLVHPAWRVTSEIAAQAVDRADRAEAVIARARAMDPAYHAASDLELIAQAMLFARPQGGRLSSFVLSRSEAGAEAKIVALVESQGSLREFAALYASALEREIADNAGGPVAFRYELADEFATEGGAAVTIRWMIQR